MHVCRAAGRAAVRLGVAVSGGSDSLALLHLLARWRRRRDAAGGDGRSRAAARGGARGRPRRRDLRRAGHRITTGCDWTGWDLAGNLQDRARRARYRLLADWAGRQRLAAVALGHTLDDQAETFLMRLARQAGVDGLSRMAAEFTPRRCRVPAPASGLPQGRVARRILSARGMTGSTIRRTRMRALTGSRRARRWRIWRRWGSERKVWRGSPITWRRRAKRCTVQAADAARRIARLEAGDAGLRRAPACWSCRPRPAAVCWRARCNSWRPARLRATVGRRFWRFGTICSQGRNAALHGCRLIVRGDECVDRTRTERGCRDRAVRPTCFGTGAGALPARDAHRPACARPWARPVWRRARTGARPGCRAMS